MARSAKRSKTPSAPESSPTSSTDVTPVAPALPPDTPPAILVGYPHPQQDEAMPEAARLERRAHLSFSQLDLYRTCSWKYYMRYLTDEEGEPSLNLARGTSGHTALEQNAKKKINTGDYMPLEQMLDVFSDSWDNETLPIKPEHLDPDEDIGKAKDDTVEALRVHRLKTAPKQLPILVEWEFNVDLSLPEYDYPLRIINGKVDIIDTTLTVVDYKFPAQRRPKSADDANMSAQLTLYDRAFFIATGKYPQRLGFMSMLPPGVDPIKTPAGPKEAFRDRELMTPSARAARWDRLAYQFMQTDKAIDAGIFIPADDPRTCSWCDYRKKCQASLVKDDFLAASIRAKTGVPNG